jgi:hypothetical protein
VASICQACSARARSWLCQAKAILDDRQVLESLAAQTQGKKRGGSTASIPITTRYCLPVSKSRDRATNRASSAFEPTSSRQKPQRKATAAIKVCAVAFAKIAAPTVSQNTHGLRRFVRIPLSHDLGKAVSNVQQNFGGIWRSACPLGRTKQNADP